jgi:P-aminobenzoate N-oxygenase AurF
VNGELRAKTGHGELPAVERWIHQYRSRFERWDEDAIVHTPHKIAPFEDDLLFFSPAVAAPFLHPAVEDAPEEVRRQILVLSLFDWLEFTEWLEMGPVNDSCNLLRRPHFLPWIPAGMRLDALRIYTDEAGHAQMSHELAREAERATGVTSLQLRPSFLDSFEAIVANHDSHIEPLLTLCFAIVSETLITGSLKRLPADEKVQLAVREFARHHAQDEARHHHYFRELCEMLWPRLPRELRLTLGSLLPEMILTFLKPSYDAMFRVLSQFPQTFEHPARLASELIASSRLEDGVKQACNPTLRMFANAGVFDDQVVLDSFAEHGLRPSESMLEKPVR